MLLNRSGWRLLPTLLGLTLALATLTTVSPLAFAQSPVTVVLDPNRPASTMQHDFIGLSFEIEKVLPDANGRYFFSSTNKPLVALFKTLGIKSLRVGGNTADRPTIKLPAQADIDSLFDFARAADASVIYTLRLRQGDPQQSAQTARYIVEHYRPDLSCFAIGNEPNVFAKEYPTYRDEWKKYVDLITSHEVAPDAKFCGPSATPGKTAWARDFIRDFGHSGRIAFVSQHDYPGGAGNKVQDPAMARDQMLSPAWVRKYERFYDAFAAPALSNGLPYRVEEANNFFNGGAFDVSDTFASALWALDYLHWWAAHGAGGINFHTGDQVAAGERMSGCRYATFWTSAQGYSVHPIGYGIKAFELGSRGRYVPVSIATNAGGLNLTAYGDLSPDKSLYLTLINKEHTSSGRSAKVIICPGESYVAAQKILMTAPDGDVSAKSGVTIGGVPIEDDGTWDGLWSPLLSPTGNGQFIVKVPAATAAVVRFR